MSRRARAALVITLAAVGTGCSGSLSVPRPSTTTAPAASSGDTTTTSATSPTSLPVVTRSSTTTTSTSLDIPPNASSIAVASHDEVVAVIGDATWDDSLPVPQAGLAHATWRRDDDRGGTLTMMMPASAPDSAGFFRLQLSQRGFVFGERDAGGTVSFDLGGQASITVDPGGVAACTIIITVTL